MLNNEQIFDTVMLAGSLLLTSGAEIHRVEETMELMARKAGLSNVEVFATPTGIFMTAKSPEDRVYTRVRRIRRVDNDLSKIAQINSLSRAFMDGMPIEEVLEELKKIQATENKYNWKIRAIGGIGSGSFAYLFGGNTWEAILGAIIGFTILTMVDVIGEHRVPRFLLTMAGGALAAIMGKIFVLFFDLDRDIIILSGVMVLVPGVLITTAVRDVISGELLSGVARSAEAATIAVAVAAGVALVLGWGGA